VLLERVIVFYQLGREGKECFFRRVDFWDEGSIDCWYS